MTPFGANSDIHVIINIAKSCLVTKTSSFLSQSDDAELSGQDKVGTTCQQMGRIWAVNKSS